jgi:hypothetical protein
MFTVVLSPGVNPIVVKYNHIIYHIMPQSIGPYFSTYNHIITWRYIMRLFTDMLGTEVTHFVYGLVHRFYNKGIVLQIPAGKINLLLLQSDETGPGAHPTSCSFGTGSSFHEGKMTCVKLTSSLPSSV